MIICSLNRPHLSLTYIQQVFTYWQHYWISNGKYMLYNLIHTRIFTKKNSKQENELSMVSRRKGNPNRCSTLRNMSAPFKFSILFEPSFLFDCEICKISVWMCKNRRFIKMSNYIFYWMISYIYMLFELILSWSFETKLTVEDSCTYKQIFVLE